MIERTNERTNYSPIVSKEFLEILYQTEKIVKIDLDNKIEWKKINDVTKKVENIKWGNYTVEKFNYIDLSSINRDNNKIISTEIINKNNAPSRAKQIILENDIIFGTTRPLLKRLSVITKEYNNHICSTGFCVLRVDNEKILPKWVFYCLETEKFYSYVSQLQKGASYPAITDNEVKAYSIPIPALEIQRYIIEILDKFQTLINDISQGLPKEIELREKQYIYYREKLLNFKK